MFKEESSSKEDINISVSEGKNFSGEIIFRENEAYKKLSETFTTKGSPSVILRPHNSEDVASAIQYAIKNSFQISIRSGGHGLPGFATNMNGVVIDLSAINKIEVIDKQKNIVRIGAGALWGDVAEFLRKYNLAISSGDIKSVGVGGLTLGGGIGWMVRKVGLTIDNLISAEVVTADGKILNANNLENPDLFWALKGGGGNFGVVTKFDFTAQSIKKVVAGSVQYGIENLVGVLKSWRDYMRIADEKLNSTIKIMPALFGNPPAIFVLFCYADKDGTEAQNSIAPLLDLGQIQHKDIKEIDYPDLLEEAVHPPDTIKVVVKNIMIKNFSDEVIQIISEMKGPAIQIRSLGGAVNRVSAEATAFASRDAEVLVGAGMFVPLAAPESEQEKIIKVWDTIKPFGSGIYSNFLSEEEDIKNIFPELTYSRLLEVKKKYDPKNIYTRNFNIR